MHARMRSRSRWERAAAADGELSTLPGKRRVLSVILAGDIVPCQAQRMHVALGGMGEREAIPRARAGAPGIELKCSSKGACAVAGADGHLPGQARTYEVAVTGFVVLPAHPPLRRCHRSTSVGAHYTLAEIGTFYRDAYFF